MATQPQSPTKGWYAAYLRIANATTVDSDWDEIAVEIGAWDRLLEQDGL